MVFLMFSLENLLEKKSIKLINKALKQLYREKKNFLFSSELL